MHRIDEKNLEYSFDGAKRYDCANYGNFYTVFGDNYRIVAMFQLFWEDFFVLLVSFVLFVLF